MKKLLFGFVAVFFLLALPQLGNAQLFNTHGYSQITVADSTGATAYWTFQAPNGNGADVVHYSKTIDIGKYVYFAIQYRFAPTYPAVGTDSLACRWTVQISNDATNWNSIDSVSHSAVADTVLYQYKCFTTLQTSPARYMRLVGRTLLASNAGSGYRAYPKLFMKQ